MNRTLGGSIETVPERCRVCYTCVRECPAKAIRINNGQAEVIASRCIGCGNCVRVCSQKAKRVVSTIEQVREMLADRQVPVAALLAPSFPAEFIEHDYQYLIGQIRALGFAAVHEVGFGADLVARRYRELVDSGDARPQIATTCPAVVLYVEKFQPQLVEHLAPVVSPMVAMARVVRHQRRGQPVRLVFIGPCIAKKCEAVDACVPGEIDAALTFAELRTMIAEAGIRPEDVTLDDFDPPHASLGGLFAVSRGLLQAAELPDDLLARDVIATEGRTNFVDAIKAFDAGRLDARLLEALACEGCISGAGISSSESLFERRARVSDYVRHRLTTFDKNTWRRNLHHYAGAINLTRGFEANDQRIPMPTDGELRDILARMGKTGPEDELNCGACGYDTCREHAIAIHRKLAENEMCLPYTIERLNHTVGELAASNEELADTRDALMHSERLASMGQLAAGVAHEVNNPLGVVLMYAHMLREEVEPSSQLREDLDMIVEQADRCKRIVSRLLHFARQNKVVRAPCNIRELVERSLHTLNLPPPITPEVVHREADPIADLDDDQIIQVLTNLLSNAADAMPNGGVITVTTSGDHNQVTLEVRDTGVGIPAEVLPKIFEPFFTTKQIGRGTGLGLAVTYGIVKMHRGDITVQSNTDAGAGPTGTTVRVTLPRRLREVAAVDEPGAGVPAEA